MKFAVDQGIIDLSHLLDKANMIKKQEALKKHPYAITQGKDGKWRTYLPDKEKGRRLIKKSTKESIESVVIDYWEEKSTNPTIEEVFYDWLRRKHEHNEIATGTYNRYERDFKRFFLDAFMFGKKGVKDVKEKDVEEFVHTVIAKYKLTARCFGNVRILLYGIFKHAKREKLIDWSITQVISDMEISRRAFKKVVKEDYQEVFSEEEMGEVLAYLLGKPDIINLGLALIFCTGLRVGELSALRREDVSRDAIKVRRTEISYHSLETGKKIYEVRDYPKSEAGIRTIMIPESYKPLIDAIEKLNPSGEYFFEIDGERVRTYRFRHRIYYVCSKTQIYMKSTHKIRKTYASILMDSGIDKSMIEGSLGHTNIRTTEKYYHRNRKDDKRKADIINNIPEFQVEVIKGSQK